MGPIPPADRSPSTRRSSADGERCIPAADRTAFAFGEFEGDADGARREAISRHLLRCAACRAEVDAVSALGARLRGFGAGGDWEADVGAAMAAERGRARVRRRAALAGFAAAAAVVAALGVGIGFGRDSDSRSPASDAGPVANSTGPTSGDVSRTAPAAPSVPPATPASSPRVAADRATLLAAQSSDGRFSASAKVGGSRRDEATTGLAVLALVGESHGLPHDPAAARAVADAVRWLRLRQTATGRFGAEATGSPRDQAIATAALLEVSAVTGDAALRAAADRGVRALARDADGAGSLRDEEGGRWVRSVLARARALATMPKAGAAPSVDEALAGERWPAGICANASPYGRALAVVDRPRRE